MIEMSSQECHAGDAAWWFLENKRGKCSVVLYQGLLSLWSATGVMGAMGSWLCLLWIDVERNLTLLMYLCTHVILLLNQDEGMRGDILLKLGNFT